MIDFDKFRIICSSLSISNFVPVLTVFFIHLKVIYLEQGEKKCFSKISYVSVILLDSFLTMLQSQFKCHESELFSLCHSKILFLKLFHFNKSAQNWHLHETQKILIVHDKSIQKFQLKCSKMLFAEKLLLDRNTSI